METKRRDLTDTKVVGTSPADTLALVETLV